MSHYNIENDKNWIQKCVRTQMSVSMLKVGFCAAEMSD
jgi:hypothetical protein